MSTCTIVITTKDRPEFVHRAVASALSQTVTEIEVIVVDDGSSVPYAPERDDPRLRVHRHNLPQGVNSARNAGLHLAQGEWITFLDDDDLLTSDMVEASLKSASTSLLPRPVALLSGVQPINSRGMPLGPPRLPVAVPLGGLYFLEKDRAVEREQSFRVHNTLVAPVDVLRRIDGWNEEIKAWAHNEFFLRLNQACSIDALPKVTYFLTEHDGPRRSTSKIDNARGIEETIRLHSDLIDARPGAGASLCRAASLDYLAGGAWSESLRAAIRGVRSEPKQVLNYAVLSMSLMGPRMYRWWKSLTRRPL